MDSVVKLGHQINGDPVIQVCHLLQLFHLAFCQKKSPSDCFCLPCTGIFLKLITFQGFIFIADKLCLAKRICFDDLRNSNSFFPGGRIYGHEVSGCRRHYVISKLLQLFLVMNLITEDINIETLITFI